MGHEARVKKYLRQMLNAHTVVVTYGTVRHHQDFRVLARPSSVGKRRYNWLVWNGSRRQKFVMQAGGTRNWYACIIMAQKRWDGDTSAAQKKSKLRQGTRRNGRA